MMILIMEIILSYTMKNVFKRLNFIFDYVTPHGHLGFGYQRKEM